MWSAPGQDPPDLLVLPAGGISEAGRLRLKNLPVMNTQELLRRLSYPCMGLAAMLGLSSLLLIGGWFREAPGAEIFFSMIRALGVPAAALLGASAWHLRGGSGAWVLLIQVGCQLSASCAMIVGLSTWVQAWESMDYARMALAGPLLAATSWWCLEANYRYARWRKVASAQPASKTVWSLAALSVFLDFLVGKVGDPKESLEVRRMRSKAIFMGMAIPPAVWVAALSKVLGPNPTGSMQVVYVGPALVWVGAWFVWMVRTYGPASRN